MENQSQSFHPTFLDRNAILIKGIITGLLILIMLIPQSFIRNLITERQQRQQEVVQEISDKWAGEQIITGPVLMVPYLVNPPSGNTESVPVIRKAYFLPDQLLVTGTIDTSTRRRVLYPVTLYRTSLQLTGRFGSLPVGQLNIAPERMLWNEARMMMGISDVRGLEDEITLNWNNGPLSMEAGLPQNDVLKQNGLHAAIPVTIDGGSFSIKLNIKGSGNLSFTPVGKNTDVRLSSTWNDPSFSGNYLPASSQITDNGFTAMWKVPNVSRQFPQYWKDMPQDLVKDAFGVRLIQPADGYAKTERSVKYALLFIGLTFAIFYFLEILQKRQIHPIQYLLVGFALCIFYTLLLSISEYKGFNIAYLIAATATVLLIGNYIWGVLRSIRIAGGFTAALAGLYTYIYILIQQEDKALLFGSIGLFLILAALMYGSRKINWYQATGNNRTV